MSDGRTQVDLLIRCRAAVTVDPERRIIENAGVAVCDGKIVAIDKWDFIAELYHSSNQVGSTKMVALPGLIDAHIHSPQCILRGCADDVGWLPYLRDYIWPLQGVFTEEDALASLSLTLLDTIKSGTTLYMDPLIVSKYGFDGMAETILGAGTRAVLAKMVMDMEEEVRSAKSINAGMIESREKSLHDADEAIRKWHGREGRLKVFLGPRVPRPHASACTPSFYRELSQLAKEYGTGLTIHLAGERDDPPFFSKEFNRTPVEFIHSVGLTGDNMALVMCCWIAEGDIQILKDTGTHVVHCPSANMKLASGVTPVPRLLGAGVNVCLGTDSGANNNCHDLIREMKATSLLHNIHNMDSQGLIAETALEMATINGARAVGMENELGSLEVGKRADIVLVDFEKPHLYPPYDIISNLVYAGMGSDVDTVIVDGRVIMEHRIVRTLDEERILATSYQRGKDILARANVNVSSGWPIV